MLKFKVMDIYREKLLDHYHNPRNYGELLKATNQIRVENVSCGDTINMQVLISKKTLKKVKFMGEGCAIAIAAASILSEHAQGKPLEQLKKLQLADLLKLMGVELTLSRRKCASLCLESLKAAIKST
ncbi:MAG TPA: iron-sulfur cluster assembly scaffold protein [Candidatus Dojkabacteria bacterium]|nr:iron-sulfur cluster assembly scaffold protein [Candidatus Dojkabacteria bacterium]